MPAEPIYPSRPAPRDLGLALGELPAGPLNAITDVPGVLVGHCSVVEGERVRTGVTVIRPHGGNVFRNKVAAAVHTINGYGKPCGFEQVRELGTLESPIAFTSTLCVPRVADGLLTWLLNLDAGIGRTTSTVNVLVGECNDGYLNDGRGRHVYPEHALAALEGAAGGPVLQGAVGAGVGMAAYGFKGGVGTASRRLGPEQGGYTLGALVVSNLGRRQDLTLAGVPVGSLLEPGEPRQAERGSIMIALATDAPLSSRQLGRLCRRAAHGLARTGSTSGHGSGDFAVAFSTAQHIPHEPGARELSLRCLSDDSPALSLLFQAVVEAVEESVVASLFCAPTVRGRDGHVLRALPVPETLALLRRYARL